MTTANDQTNWTPLGIDEDEIEVFTALRDDVPDHLRRSVWSWITARFSTSSGGSRGLFNVSLARECERVLKLSIPDNGPYQSSSFRNLQTAINDQPPKITWRLVDFLLSKYYSTVSSAKSFDDMLVEAGSAWMVSNRHGKIGLVRRLPEGVQVAAERILQQGTAGKRLTRAWEAAFGVNPDPSQAYWFAVKAVEDASAPVVIPNDPGPTLGKVISRMEQGGQFNLPNLREDSRAVTHDVLLGMLRMLWVGQYDRHGGLPASPLPDNVTQPEAESAVMLAVTLVGWFESGHVQQ